MKTVAKTTFVNKEDVEKLRMKIVVALRVRFETESSVLSYWLWGSDANDESDEYSDLDLFFCVQDGQETWLLEQAKQVLTTFWSLDYMENIDFRTVKTEQTFHIKDTPESLLIEVCTLPESKWMEFVHWHPAYKPKIMFDKNRAIRYRSLDKDALERSIRTQLAEQKNLMSESGRAVKYVKRNEYVEATNYYVKYVYLPLVSVLRIKYTPLLHDWLRIHISRHFPKDVVIKLEDLMRFSSLEDLLERIAIAREWFRETVEELEKNGDYSSVDSITTKKLP